MFFVSSYLVLLCFEEAFFSEELVSIEVSVVYCGEEGLEACLGVLEEELDGFIFCVLDRVGGKGFASEGEMSV